MYFYKTHYNINKFDIFDHILYLLFNILLDLSRFMIFSAVLSIFKMNLFFSFLSIYLIIFNSDFIMF